MTKNSREKQVLKLWPDGPPRQNKGVGQESEFFPPEGGMGAGTLMLRNVSEPSLTVFHPRSDVANGVGVVICPGGGFRMLAWALEGMAIGEWLAELGYTVMVLKYRTAATPESEEEFNAAMLSLSKKFSGAVIPGRQARQRLDELPEDEFAKEARLNALDDIRRAFEIVHESADEWGVNRDKIGVLGFSAGANLSVDFTMDPEGPPPAFLAAAYGGDTRGQPIPDNAPPLFTVVAQDDRMFFRVVENLYADWAKADRSSELHIFARGGHAFGLDSDAPCSAWADLFTAWLADNGFA